LSAKLSSQDLITGEIDFFLEKYKLLILIRKVELSIGLESKVNTFQTPVHLAIGQ